MNDKHNEILKQISENLTIETIANNENVSIRYVKDVAKRFKVNYITEKDVIKQSVINLCKEGKTVKEIQDQFNLSHKTIIKWIRESGLETNTSISKPNDDNLISKIKNLVENGLTNSQISQNLGICQSTVMKYVKRLNLETNSIKKKSIVNQSIELTQFQ